MPYQPALIPPGHPPCPAAGRRGGTPGAGRPALAMLYTRARFRQPGWRCRCPSPLLGIRHLSMRAGMPVSHRPSSEPLLCRVSSLLCIFSRSLTNTHFPGGVQPTLLPAPLPIGTTVGALKWPGCLELLAEAAMLKMTAALRAAPSRRAQPGHYTPEIQINTVMRRSVTSNPDPVFPRVRAAVGPGCCI